MTTIRPSIQVWFDCGRVLFIKTTKKPSDITYRTRIDQLVIYQNGKRFSVNLLKIQMRNNINSKEPTSRAVGVRVRTRVGRVMLNYLGIDNSKVYLKYHETVPINEALETF
jgi:hypothetical protein